MIYSACRGVIAAALLCACASAAGATADAPLTVVAFAADVDSVVFRDASGQLLRRAVGADLGNGWRIAAVRADRVELRAVHAVAGQPYLLTLKRGQQIDLAAAARAVDDLRAPQTLPHSVTSASPPRHGD